MFISKNGKRQVTEGVKLPNKDKIRTLGEKEIYKYLGILEADTMKEVAMKKKHWFTKKLRQAPKYPILPNLRVQNSNLKSVFTHRL